MGVDNMGRSVKNQEGFALVLVMLMLIILSLTLVVVSTGIRAQADAAAGVSGAATAVARAEDGIAVAWARLQNGMNFNGGTVFTVNNGGWTTRIQFIDSGANQFIRSTSSRGRYSRTIQVEYTPGQNAPNPLNRYYMASGGTMSLTNGSYDIKGNTLYARNIMTLGSCWMTSSNQYGPGKLVSSETVNMSNMSAPNNVSVQNHAPEETIPDVNWQRFADAAWKTYNNVSSDLDISNDLRNANGGIVVVRVSGGSPRIRIGAQDFSNRRATIVIIRDNPAANPQLVVGNGTYINTEINAFVDGTVDFSSGCFKTSGVLYATGDISLTNGTYEITGGVTSQRNVMTTSVSFGVYNPQWDQWNEYFEDLQQQAPTMTNWREL